MHQFQNKKEIGNASDFKSWVRDSQPISVTNDILHEGKTGKDWVSLSAEALA